MRTALTLYWIDAFTQRAYAGNPCAVVMDADALSASAMQQIAREMNLSETAFVMASSVADVRARYFTPAEEIPLAGHPTIAVSQALLVSGRLPASTRHYRLQLEAGVIDVDLEPDAAGRTLITMQQLAPRFGRRYAPTDVLSAFGLAPEDALPGAAIMTVSTGTPQLMVPLRSPDALRRATPQPERYAALRTKGDFFSPHLFVLQGADAQGRTFARHFGLPPASPEDPFTGSATGGMAAYLWSTGLIDSPRFVAQQGHWMQRPGQAFVEVVGARDAISAVRVGGHAVEVLRGEIDVSAVLG
jgi:trans-2,3-dihydro-3-hydroxyanthranilate isomerase